MTTATTVSPTPKDWIQAHDAMAILCVPRPAFKRLVEDGELTSRKVPGCRVLVLRSEVERLAQSSTRPARPQSLVYAGAGA